MQLEFFSLVDCLVFFGFVFFVQSITKTRTDGEHDSTDKSLSVSGGVKESSILSDYYLHVFADPGLMICTVLLTENNYERWAKLKK